MLSQIDGVLTFPVLSIPDERGCVWKMKNPLFPVVDTYVTTVHYGVIKAWHGYKTKKLFYTVVSGMVKLVLFDGRSTSDTFKVFDELFLGNDSRFSVQIPAMVFAGFQGLSKEDAIITVQASEPYQQIYRLSPNELDYDWGTYHG